MIRQAQLADMDQIDAMFEEYFQYEKKVESYTIFQRGIFPTRAGMENAVANGVTYVHETDGVIDGCIIFDEVPPPEFANITWRIDAGDAMRAINLMLVRPSSFRKGIARALLTYAEEQARAAGCLALRTECGSQNMPAVLLFRHFGFERVAVASIKVSGIVPSDGHLFFEKAL